MNLQIQIELCREIQKNGSGFMAKQAMQWEARLQRVLADLEGAEIRADNASRAFAHWQQDNADLSARYLPIKEAS